VSVRDVLNQRRPTSICIEVLDDLSDPLISSAACPRSVAEIRVDSLDAYVLPRRQQ
jgi:hypothetical protein